MPPSTTPAPARAILKSKLLWAAAIVGALVALYAVLGFYAAPRLVRSQAIKFVHEQYGRDLTIGEVRVNPFKLQLTVADVAFPDADRQTMLGLKRLFVDFEASSLWKRAFVFQAVDIDAPYVRAVVRPNGTMNLADLALKEPTPPPAEEPSALPRVWIESLDVREGHADFSDQARRTPFTRTFAPITFALKDFRTTPEGGDFHLAARTERAEGVDWKGRFALAPRVSSQGEFTVTALKATGVAELLGDALPFGLTSGLINLAGEYQFALDGKTNLKVELPRIEVSDLHLRARGTDVDWIEIPGLTVADTRLALPEQSVAVANVTVTGLKAQAWRAADGSINLTQLVTPPAEAATPGGATAAATAPESPGAAAPPQPAPAPAASAPWKVQLGGLDLQAATVNFEDRSVAPAASFAVSPMNVSVKGLSLDLAQPVAVSFDAKIDGTASLTGSGRITPEPLAADVDIALAGFDLRAVQPYVGASTAMTIRGGALAVQGKVTVAPPGSKDGELRFAGDANVTKFRSIDDALEQDFVNFERLEIAKIRYTQSPDRLEVDSVRLNRPYARVVVGANRIVNVSAVLDPKGTAAQLQARGAEDAAKAAAAEAEKHKSRAQRRADTKAAQAAAKARAKAPPPPAPELKETGMPIRIRTVRVDGGSLDFADFSIQPNFHAEVQSLRGSVTGLSSDPKSRARVDLQGNVGEFSPVTIAGTVQPFAYDRYTDIGLKFENISLPVFNPYSGKYAGYNIAKGKLTTELHYTIADRKLDAQHHLRIDQLEWGEATAEKGEATLPVKFATSLLKDADGVISLDIPVSGTLDDPKFRVGPIVWQIIKNILTKVVTAPFKALGALFKGAEEAQFVDFAPGSATLEAATLERLAALGKSLAAKPDLKLDVPLGAIAELDLASIQETRYQAELAKSMDRVLRGKKGGDTPLPAFDTLDDDKKIDVLTALVQRLSGAKPKLPPAPEPPEGTSRKDARALARAAEIDYLAKDARSRLVPATADLEELGKARGEAIQKALLTDTGLDPQRIFLSKNGKVLAQDGRVRFELGVK